MEKLRKLKLIPTLSLFSVALFLMLVLTQTGQDYDWVPQGYCYGTGCYTSGRRPGNFYQACFSYDGTLPAFILLMINLLLVIVALIFAVVLLAKKTMAKGVLKFLIVFAFIYLTTGLVMAIYMAAASSISDAGGMIAFAFLAWISSGGVLSSFYLLKHADEANAEVVKAVAAPQKQEVVASQAEAAPQKQEAVASKEESGVQETQPVKENKPQEEQKSGSNAWNVISKIFGIVFPTSALGLMMLFYFISSIIFSVNFFENLINWIKNLQETESYTTGIIFGSDLFRLIGLFAIAIMSLVFFISHMVSKFDGAKTLRKMPALGLVYSIALFLTGLLGVIYAAVMEVDIESDLFSINIALLIFSVLVFASSIVALAFKPGLAKKIVTAVSFLFIVILLFIVFSMSSDFIAFTEAFIATMFILLAQVNFFLREREN